MEGCLKTAVAVAVAATPMTISTDSAYSRSHSPPSSQLSPTSVLVLPPPPPHPVVLSPCAACKILRRRCIEKCMLAPYFPPNDPHKFTIAHRELPESSRADAVSSMVYEANARLRDPVYGCAGTICHLQKQISELQGELAKAQAEMVNLQCRQSNILTLIRMQMDQPPLPVSPPLQQQQTLYDNICFFDDNANLGSLGPLWT
ncbi:lateral organ boundaries domain-containing protein [Cynara cardunculus var. scolymus]|uniref:Lateral organ boundaries domain-containing protein n=1 Tax=Cynara cardunculus var. scolymus TaxID=59895 RepID=A0A103Y9H7_CYNCS|nr:lateral organ boundaries domain-containing protein [Cynara cardunculus var. scolymus]